MSKMFVEISESVVNVEQHEMTVEVFTSPEEVIEVVVSAEDAIDVEVSEVIRVEVPVGGVSWASNNW